MVKPSTILHLAYCLFVCFPARCSFTRFHLMIACADMPSYASSTHTQQKMAVFISMDVCFCHAGPSCAYAGQQLREVILKLVVLSAVASAKPADAGVRFSALVAASSQVLARKLGGSLNESPRLRAVRAGASAVLLV